jgi:HAD superfamily hydrolase (TIGR01509 family)
MWIGTTGTGFAICNPGDDYQHLTFDCYSMKDGLPNGVIQSIVEDQDHKMWIATEYGISRFTPATKQIENYYFSSYTLGNVYSENTACINTDGRLLFGTNYGLVALDTHKVENMEKPVSTVFTGLHINGTHMLPGMEDLLRDLKRHGYGVWGLTNWSHETIHIAFEKFPQIGELLQDTVVSGIEKMHKPNADIYELALQRFGLEAGHCVFFDDTAKNIVGANEVGIHGLLFDNALQARESLASLGVRL